MAVCGGALSATYIAQIQTDRQTDRQTDIAPFQTTMHKMPPDTLIECSQLTLQTFSLDQNAIQYIK